MSSSKASVEANAPVFQAELELECGNTLGEGIIWDPKSKRVHWVDIDDAQIHTYEPETKKYAVDSYPDEKFVTNIALRQDEPGLVGTTRHSIVVFPQPTTPTDTSPKSQPHPRKIEQTLLSPLHGPEEVMRLTRFNDGGVDPRGRLIAGSMALPELRNAGRKGELWRLDPDGKQEQLLQDVGCSNGIGWSPDGKIMYYVDSANDKIETFAYDLETGALSDRKDLAMPPAQPGNASSPAEGVFDGLCMDGQGNVWVARWSDSRIVGYRPTGEIICHVNVPKCKSPTIPCFGGPNLDIMYIATAHSKLANKGDIQADFPHSGHLFKVDFSAGSEIRKLLGNDWTGAETYRFAA